MFVGMKESWAAGDHTDTGLPDGIGSEFVSMHARHTGYLSSGLTMDREEHAMSDIGAPIDNRDLDEQPSTATPTELPLETPEADAAEQRVSVEESGQWTVRPIRPDVDPADAADQQREIGLDEDDYR
jgi:hypothetical protein